MSQNYGYVSLDTPRRKKQRKKKILLITLITIAVLAIAATGIVLFLNMPESSENSESGLTSASQELSSDLSGGISITEVPQDSSSESESSEEEPDIPMGYDYASPVPESEIVDNSYFDDAVFIGNSRTEGLILYTGLANAIPYTNKGLSVETVFTKDVINMDGEKIPVIDALKRTEFNKVYIMLGINETGWPYSSVFAEKYGEIVDKIKSINPDAIIYIQEILPVTAGVSQTHEYVKNERIDEYNELLRQMAEEKEVYYIDVANAVADENGCLPEDAATDGIHLNKAYCEKWLEYLKTHTVTEEERQD